MILNQTSQPPLSDEILSTARGDADWFRLWGAFLRASPSYDLARRYRQNTLPDDAALPEDFETVVRVYDDLGDVRLMSRTRWWRRVAIPQFGLEASNPAVTRLGVVSHHDDDDAPAAIRRSVGDYLKEEWVEQIQPTSIIAAIPIGLPKAQIMKQLSAMIGEVVDAERKLKRPLAAAPYSLRGGRPRYSSALNYLACLMLRSKHPEMPNWRIGAMANLSIQHRNLLKDVEDGKDTISGRETLKELTSRALHRGHLMAENAARGIFPSYAPCENALPVDYPFIYRERFKFFSE